MGKAKLTRRQFLSRAGAIVAGAGVAASRMGRAWASPPRISANDKILIGHIGVGGMGRSHFDRLLDNPEVRIGAASDPDANRQQAAKLKAAEKNVNIATYADYREMLSAHPELDAVFVATPDHWHALATIDSIKAGKDVYCEKPLALTIAEGRKMVETARRYGRVVQMGTMQRSDQSQFRRACELVRNGRIGEVKRAVCFFGANPQVGYVPDEDPPPYLDWNLWLGPAQWRRFNKQIHPYNFRYFRDYSGGLLTDWGVHLFDIAQWGLGKDTTSPTRVEATGAMYETYNLYEFPRVCQIRYDYGDCSLEWRQGAGEVFEEGEGYGTKFYGTDGDVFVNRKMYTIHAKPGKTIDDTIGPNDTHLYESVSHHQDFFDCMRTRKHPICDVEIGHRATCIPHLGNIAFRLGRILDYDPVREVFPGDPAANRMIERPMRAPWRLE